MPPLSTTRTLTLTQIGLFMLIFVVLETMITVNAFGSSLGHHRVADKYQNSLHTRIHRKVPVSSGTSLSCGLLEAIQDALGGGGSTATKAAASHILLQEKTPQSKQKLIDLKAEIQDDPFEFSELAATYSDCSSATKGGDLGEFGKGVMAKEFEKVVFDKQTPIGVVQGPIETEFGYHLILVQERS